MAVEFGRPRGRSGASAERAAGFPFRRLAAEEGVLFPDSFIVVRTVGTRRTIERVIGDLRPGVTEVYLHPVVDTPALRALPDHWPARVADPDLLTNHSSTRTMPARAGLPLIAYRPLRQLQRPGRQFPPAPSNPPLLSPGHPLSASGPAPPPPP